jgi:outer membrane immunogenic protein
MKKLLLSSLAGLILTTGSALAADLYTPPPVYKAPPPAPPAVSWTGCYVDAGVGYGMYNTDSYSETSPVLVPIGAQVTNGGRGWLGRLGGGCDYQLGVGGLGNFVIGAFADYDFMSLSGTFGDPSGPVTGGEKERDAWYVGGRLGYLVTPWLLGYVDGGYTETQFDQVNFLTPFAVPVSTGLSLAGHTYNGWFIGGGTEYALNMSWLPIRGLFWRTEYRFAEYQAADVPIFVSATGTPFGVAEHVSPYVQTITSGLVWRFNFGGPIATRY